MAVASMTVTYSFPTGGQARRRSFHATAMARKVIMPRFCPPFQPGGRWLSFNPSAFNRVDDDLNGVADIFVHDRQTRRNGRPRFPHSDGTSADAWSYGNAISGDGQFVVFDSSAANLVDNDDNAASDIFVHDRQSGQTILVSRHTDGTQGNNMGGGSGISARSVSILPMVRLWFLSPMPLI